LDSRKDELAMNLPYGAQRRLEMARAMATGAKLLFARRTRRRYGINQETAELMQTIQKIQKEFHLTILLIEHDMKLVMGISEKNNRARLRREKSRKALPRKCNMIPR